eukprot:5427731-Pleurochrysis_carterae.AAC.6
MRLLMPLGGVLRLCPELPGAMQGFSTQGGAPCRQPHVPCLRCVHKGGKKFASWAREPRVGGVMASWLVLSSDQSSP